MEYKAVLHVEDGESAANTGTIAELEMWVDSFFPENAVMHRTEFERFTVIKDNKPLCKGYKLRDLFATKSFVCIAIPLHIYNTHLV